MTFQNANRFTGFLLAFIMIGLFVFGLPAASDAGPNKPMMKSGLSRMDFTNDLNFQFVNREVVSHKQANQIDKKQMATKSLDSRQTAFKSVSLSSSQVKFNVETDRAGAIKAGNAAKVSGKTVVFDRQSKYKIDKEFGKARTLLSFKSKFGTIGGSRLGYYIQGRIYADFNGNGLHDEGEPGIPNVLVEIHHAKKGKIGWVATSLSGQFDTKALSASAFNTHEFIIPEQTDKMDQAYANEVLSTYFSYSPAPEGYDFAEVMLGFTLDADALLADLQNHSISVNGQSPEQWATRLNTWSRPYIWAVNNQQLSGIEVLTGNNPSFDAQFHRELLTLELNLRARQGLAPSDPAYLGLQEILVDYGHYLLDQFDRVSEKDLIKVLEIYRAINTGQ
jgi:hypothetical protein